MTSRGTETIPYLRTSMENKTKIQKLEMYNVNKIVPEKGQIVDEELPIFATDFNSKDFKCPKPKILKYYL
jgi:hypothetical protein